MNVLSLYYKYYKMATSLPTLSGHVVTRLEENLKMQYVFIQIVFSHNLVPIRTLRAGQRDPFKATTQPFSSL